MLETVETRFGLCAHPCYPVYSLVESTSKPEGTSSADHNEEKAKKELIAFTQQLFKIADGYLKLNTVLQQELAAKDEKLKKLKAGVQQKK